MGDGAGIMLQIPDKFFREKLSLDGVTLLQKESTVSVWFLA